MNIVRLSLLLNDQFNSMLGHQFFLHRSSKENMEETVVNYSLLHASPLCKAKSIIKEVTSLRLTPKENID